MAPVPIACQMCTFPKERKVLGETEGKKLKLGQGLNPVLLAGLIYVPYLEHVIDTLSPQISAPFIIHRCT